jgi:hypothetical protein
VGGIYFSLQFWNTFDHVFQRPVDRLRHPLIWEIFMDEYIAGPFSLTTELLGVFHRHPSIRTQLGDLFRPMLYERGLSLCQTIVCVTFSEVYE